MAEGGSMELVEHLNRCRDLLTIMRDPVHRKTIIGLITFLESRLAEMDRRSVASSTDPIAGR
jgi:hypothetical protein